MPCLNESRSLAFSIRSAQDLVRNSGAEAEIIVADNRSTDGSREIAWGLGVRVVDVAGKGYGRALAAGIAAARGKFIVMADSDGSYDFREAAAFLPLLRSGTDMVIGNRFAGTIHPGAMPWLHRYVGVPLLSGLARHLYGSDIQDYHCGLRGFSRQAIVDLGLATVGMEYATEMIIRASLAGLDIAEIPVSLHPDQRGGRPPHLRTWSDGWRHLTLLLSHADGRERETSTGTAKRGPASL